ncbi:hypothetical protein C922_05346 [Plasmodium inui San Antonio 1]|uniref:Uncharacterized protein n=1 Tax=Plasmodium inui San Antonio 1 TaxID=1237626 RepID=W6ZYA9_9APIC|nr:hypothetical protein C922_05346 [Plasmodium inui San Antonio 1]EUD64280.1 hypothetical protein C922_05346 [Plasmodium inui San Antonio 1]
MIPHQERGDSHCKTNPKRKIAKTTLTTGSRGRIQKEGHISSNSSTSHEQRRGTPSHPAEKAKALIGIRLGLHDESKKRNSSLQICYRRKFLGGLSVEESRTETNKKKSLKLPRKLRTRPKSGEGGTISRTSAKTGTLSHKRRRESQVSLTIR